MSLRRIAAAGGTDAPSPRGPLLRTLSATGSLLTGADAPPDVFMRAMEELAATPPLVPALPEDAPTNSLVRPILTDMYQVRHGVPSWALAVAEAATVFSKPCLFVQTHINTREHRAHRA